MTTYNTAGKTHLKCSCGYETYLDASEVLAWQTAHASIFSGIKHQLTEVQDPTPENVNAAILQIAQSLQSRSKS